MSEAVKLVEKLGLYQVFLKLYEHNRELLNEILHLEEGSAVTLEPLRIKYVIGVTNSSHPHLIANLLGSRTQTLMQPEAIWVIGRGSGATIPISEERLSRRHAAIQYRRDTDAFYLHDLGSTNGSFVNGELVQSRQRLTDGDRIRLGNLVFTFFECRQRLKLAHTEPQLLEHLERNGTDKRMADQKARSTSPFLDQHGDIGDMTTRPLTSLTAAQQARILDRFFDREV
ncbi:MAG: FHA domain-containing protein [Spirulinaceae cyanobacterium SM2_1_0]|nr:FHA domain-containing protein [Spirulinaceae cyanobacterium SM2_1_0]